MKHTCRWYAHRRRTTITQTTKNQVSLKMHVICEIIWSRRWTRCFRHARFRLVCFEGCSFTTCEMSREKIHRITRLTNKKQTVLFFGQDFQCKWWQPIRVSRLKFTESHRVNGLPEHAEISKANFSTRLCQRLPHNYLNSNVLSQAATPIRQWKALWESRLEDLQHKQYWVCYRNHTLGRVLLWHVSTLPQPEVWTWDWQQILTPEQVWDVKKACNVENLQGISSG